jgi:hypothetical protein
MTSDKIRPHHLERADSERCRRRSSSYSLRLPLRPSNSRSLPWCGAYTAS